MVKNEIVIIHGWGSNKYNSNLNCIGVDNRIAWNKREKLIKLLETVFTVRFFNLPGFCRVEEPQKQFFDLEDFSGYFDLWIKDQNLKPKAIVGYSFGGAVALDYKVRYHSKLPIILIAPALKRRETIKSQIGKMTKLMIPHKFLDTFKSAYQFVFSKYYREGTPFLRASYDKIVRRDIRQLLDIVDPKDILLIYGDSDLSTPAEYISETVKNNHLNCFMVKGGGHNIGGTHPEIISKAILDFLSK